MLKIPVSEIVLKIKEKTGLDEAVIKKKISDKVAELSGLVSEEGAAHIVANEFGVQLFKSSETGRLQIKNILPGLRSVSFIARVLTIYPTKEFKTAKREGKVASFLVGDETGKMRVVFWDTNFIAMLENGTIKEGELIKLTNCYVKEGMNGIEVHASNRTKIEINPQAPEAQKIPALEQIWNKPEKTEIAKIAEGTSEIRGAIVYLFENNLFYETCAECGKKMREGVCVEHGQAKPKPSLIISAIVDDGTGNIRVIFFSKRAEKLLGITSEEAFKESQENADPLFPIKSRKEKLLGAEIVIDGKVSKNDFSGDLEMIANRSNLVEPVKEAKEIMKKLG